MHCTFGDWACLVHSLWSAEGVAAALSFIQGLIVFGAVIVAYRDYRTTSVAQRTSFYSNRLSDAYDLFTREWKDKQLNPPIVFYQRYNPAKGADEILDDETGKRLFEEQNARAGSPPQMATAARRLQIASSAGQGVAVFAESLAVG